jgi:threonine dehydrogenase-like Zn-dependent dehydrogenase
MYGAGDVRVETVPDPVLQEPTDAVVRVTLACVCGSDLHPYHTMPTSSQGHRWGTSSSALSRRSAPRCPVKELMPDILDGTVEPGRVFDRTIGLDETPDGYRAMDRREALKVLVRP